ncbi:hypothetical protein LTR59_011354 [Friedmanniomyces endolithicus]|nr:hypothetical protein LTR94_016664 [Friedmanniomyces endolithicus]KAK0784683.1 hypothetical protein LTR59_011354 [Friedmanniomyces endolithicus]KAK0785662.1 hypothetical protein LTR38_012262 [Friedmanniomyces endolithicus]KAK0816786.1 hypothetical protein LTR75_003469 [Friedmanniomyces endolithicus]
MVPGPHAMGALDSFTARRPNASNLPSFELPPPPLTSFSKYQGQPTTQPNLTSGTVTSFGNLLTPPSNSSADGISPSSGVNSNSISNIGAVQPYTNGTGMWPPPPNAITTSSYPYHAGPGPQSYGSSRPIFSPSLNSIVRANHSPTANESLPPPPYEISQYQTSMSMSAPSLQTAQQHMMGNSMMNGQTPVSASVTQPSPVHPQDAFARPPPTPTYYGGSQPSSTPQQATFPYTTGPSPIHQSPISAGGSLHKMSPVNGGGSMPILGQPPSYAQHRPYSYPLPGPVLSNVNNPGGQLALVGGLPHGMMGGYNSGHAASMHHMYGHSQPANPQNDRPFRCDQCPQSFNRNHDLKRHKRIHLAVKPFPCGHCDKSFSRQDALKRHVLVKGCGKAASLIDTKEIDPSLSPKSEGSNPSPVITAPV